MVVYSLEVYIIILFCKDQHVRCFIKQQGKEKIRDLIQKAVIIFPRMLSLLLHYVFVTPIEIILYIDLALSVNSGYNLPFAQTLA